MSARVRAGGNGLSTLAQCCQLALPYNPKPGCRRILARQDELDDRERTAFVDPVEGSLQKPDDRAVAGGIDRPGQGHVEPKVFEDEGVSPAVEVFDLAGRSRRRRRACPAP